MDYNEAYGGLTKSEIRAKVKKTLVTKSYELDRMSREDAHTFGYARGQVEALREVLRLLDLRST